MITRAQLETPFALLFWCAVGGLIGHMLRKPFQRWLGPHTITGERYFVPEGAYEEKWMRVWRLERERAL